MKILSLLFLFISPTLLLVNVDNPENDQKEIYFDISQAKQHLEAVRVLDLSNKGYQKLPYDISKMLNLEQLRFSGNSINVVPDYFTMLSKLEILDLGNNVSLNLKRSIPAISKSKNLKKLYLNDCALSFVPTNIGELDRLESIDLSNNYLFELPYYMSKLSHLKHIDLSNNKLLELGYAPSLWHNLETINLQGNDSLDINNAFLSLSYLKKLKSASFSNVSQIPESVKKLKCESLNFVNSSLSVLPETLAENKSIKTFTIEKGKGTDFKALLSEIKNIKTLEEVRFSNCFEKVPSRLKELHQLKNLDISNNKLTEIELKSEDFPKLTVLNINGNNISDENLTELQKEFPKCAIVSDNHITSVKQNKISPPIENLQIKKKTYSIKPSKEIELTFENTKITIPKNAFLDKNGKIIKTPVDIEYREFHDPLDVILSGIPMCYDTSGKQTNLETAGMIEFRATSNGKEVFPNKKAIIQVNMDSKRTENGYNTYKFDEKKGWTYVKPSVATNNETVEVNPITAYNDFYFYRNARTMRQSKPTIGLNNLVFYIEKLKGKKAYEIKKNVHTVSNISNKKSMKSLMIFKKFKFISDEASARLTKRFLKKFNKSMGKTSASYLVAQYIEIDKGNDCFNLVAEYIDTTIILPFRIPSSSINHERDQKKTLKFWKTYKKLKEKERRENVKIENNYASAMETYEKELEIIQKDNRELIAKNNNQKTSLTTVKRSFMLEGFGLWNCDRIGVAAEPILVKAVFKDANGEVFQPTNVMVIDETDNGVVTFVGSDISMDKANNNAIVVITQDEKIGFIRSRDLGLLRLKSKTKTFIPLTYISTKDVSIKELKNMIQS